MNAYGIAALMLLVGGLGFVGGTLDERTRTVTEIEEAWSQVTIVADGTLIANPSAYAYAPDKLAAANEVRIIDNRRAAISAAWRAE